MFGSIRVARFFGIDIEINLSWFLILALVAWTLADSVFPAQYEWSRAAFWTIGIIAAVLLFVTVLIHEMAHALGIATIAEYANSGAVVDRLSHLGVDYAQGYAFSVPVPLETLL